DRHGRAKTVAVHDFAVKQVGHCGQPDVRVGPYVETVAGAKFGWTEMVEENEGANHSRARRRQRTAHGKAPEINGAGHDHLAYGGLGVLAGKETHGGLLCTDMSLARAQVEKTQSVAAGDSACLLGWKLREPVTIFLEDCVVTEPALVDPRVGTKQEPIGITLK